MSRVVYGVDSTGQPIELRLNDDGTLPITVPPPVGGATEAKQDVQISGLASIDGKLPDLGQALSAASVPVVIASDQGDLPVTASALPLPAGAATEAKQDTEIAALQSINTVVGANITGPLALESSMQTGLTTLQAVSDSTSQTVASIDALLERTPALGQALAAASSPVVLPAAQQTALAPLTLATAPHATRLTDGTSFYKATTPADTQPVSVGSLPLPTGASTEATLTAMSAKLPASLGTKTAAGSLSTVKPTASQTAAGAPTPAANGVIKASGGRLVKVRVSKRATGKHYFQLHDAAAVVGISSSTMMGSGYAIDGDGTEIVVNFADAPMDFATGIVWAMSSTQDTYTAEATNVTVSAQWE